MLKIALSDITTLLRGIATVIALISAVIVTLSLGVLTALSLGGASATGIDLFLRLMNMDSGIYLVGTAPIAGKSAIFTTLQIFNWLVLVGGVGSALLYSARQYLDSLQYRSGLALAGTGALRATVNLAADSNKDDFKQAGNS